MKLINVLIESSTDIPDDSYKAYIAIKTVTALYIGYGES